MAKADKNGAIPNGWKVTTLGEVAEILDSKRIPLSSAVRAKRKGKYPYYGASDIVDYIDDYIFDGEYLLISEDGENLNTRNTPIAFIANGKFWVNNHAHILKGKLDHLNKYLCWYFSKIDINSYISGAVQPKLSKSNLERIPILMPENESEQRAIAAVLSSLDDKIELLREQNKTLEATAQTIFKEWFVNFNFPGATGKMIDSEMGKIPEGWRVGKLGDLINHVKESILPLTSPSDFFNSYSIPAFDSGRNPEVQKGAEILSNKYVVKQNSFLVSKLNPKTPRVWTIFDIKKKSICSTEFQVLKSKTDDNFSFIHCFLNSEYFKNEFASKVSGTSSSHQRAKLEDILNMIIIFQDNVVTYQFQNLVYPMLKEVNSNLKQSQILSVIRDVLLQELMSGKMRVNYN